MNAPKLRSSVLAYMNTVPDPNLLPDYRLMGDGFTNLVQLKEPTEYTRKFINAENTTTDIIRYASEVQYEVDVFSADPVIRMILGITDAELLSVRTDVVTVYADDIVARPAYCIAFRRKYLIIPERLGEDVDVLRTGGRMVAYGEKEYGFFDRETSRFIARSPFVGSSVMYYNRGRYNIGTHYAKEV